MGMPSPPARKRRRVADDEKDAAAAAAANVPASALEAADEADADEEADGEADADVDAAPWFAEGRVDEAVVELLEDAFADADVLGTGCDGRAGASYAFLSTRGVADGAAAAVTAAVRKAAAPFALDWDRHAVAPLFDADDGYNLDAKFVRYRVGDRVPPIHLDASLTGNGRQVCNALLYLSACGGGETILDAAAPRPRVVAPERGKVLVWRSLQYDPIRVERRALHTANPVTSGEKRALAIAIRFRARAQGG